VCCFDWMPCLVLDVNMGKNKEDVVAELEKELDLNDDVNPQFATSESSYTTPAIFAGLDFYKVLMINMRASAVACINGDFFMWLSVLRQRYSWTRPYIRQADAEFLDKEFKLIEMKLISQQKYFLNSHVNKEIMLFNIRQSISKIEDKLQDATKELYLKTSEGENLDNIDFVKASRGF